MLKFRKPGGDVGEHEELRILIAVGEHVETLVGQLYRTVLLVDDEIERVGDLRHLARVVLQVIGLGLEQGVLHTLFREELDKGAVFGQPLEGAEQQELALFAHLLVVRLDLFLGLGKNLGDQTFLCLEDFLYVGLVLVEHLVVTLGHGTGDDEGGTGIVDKHRVNLVDDGVIVLALNHVLGRHGHVVAQVVETELVVGTEGDVALVGAAACGGVGAVLVDTVYGRAVEHIQRTHPFRVTFRQVVVDGHNMHALLRERAQEHGKRGHEGLAPRRWPSRRSCPGGARRRR